MNQALQRCPARLRQQSGPPVCAEPSPHLGGCGGPLRNLSGALHKGPGQLPLVHRTGCSISISSLLLLLPIKKKNSKHDTLRIPGNSETTAEEQARARCHLLAAHPVQILIWNRQAQGSTLRVLEVQWKEARHSDTRDIGTLGVQQPRFLPCIFLNSLLKHILSFHIFKAHLFSSTSSVASFSFLIVLSKLLLLILFLLPSPFSVPSSNLSTCYRSKKRENKKFGCSMGVL